MLVIKDPTHNLNELEKGPLSYGKPYTFTYKVDNVGTETQKILGTGRECTCTNSSFDKSELQPGESGTLTVVFTPNQRGNVNKSCWVQGENQDRVYTYFSANVI